MRDLPGDSRARFHYKSYSWVNAFFESLTYWLICLLVLGVIILSWFFVLEVSTSSPGIIRPSQEVTVIRSAYGGRIKKSFLRENQLVDVGDTLYSIESDALVIRRNYLLSKLRDLNNIVEDLSSLTNRRITTSPKSSLMQHSRIAYLQRITDAMTRVSKAKRDYDRNARLHSENVIADAEFEVYKYELERANNELSIIRKSQINEWQSELTNYEREINNAEAELADVDHKIRSMVVCSPIRGTVQALAGIYPGSIVYENQDLAQISPNSDLIVEAYVSPGNIGLLRNGMKVKFQINAFNYNQWGFGEGEVIDISDDIHIVNDNPAFKIRCSLVRDHLTLKNGHRGKLKKGMSVQARFVVTERTLWQLLYDKVDNWLNPNTSTQRNK